MGPARWLPWALVVPVLAVHLTLAALWPEDRFGLGEGMSAGAPPARIDVSFVRELQPAVPVPPAPVTRVLRGFAPRAPASASRPHDDDATTPVLESAPAAPAVPSELAAALPEIAPAPELAAALSPAASASSPSPHFEWPPSTRLSYLLTGNYHGPVSGQARVEWRLAGERYQVSLEVGIGPPFAPFVTRQLQSEGLVTAAGLEPRRYDEETHVAFRQPRRLTIALDTDRVLLPSGRELPRPAGVQDSASQFVQMTWLFTMQPERLRAGQAVQLPLALPRHVEIWTYDVIGEARLETPVGAIDAVHVRPRRPPRAAGASAASADLTAEFWVAPSLQYLPVRILIRQDDETYVDLVLKRLPEQAERR